MGDRSEAQAGPTPGRVDPREFQALAEQLDRMVHAIESLENRTNTLVRLLDILNKRVDRLETARDSGSR